MQLYYKRHKLETPEYVTSEFFIKAQWTSFFNDVCEEAAQL